MKIPRLKNVKINRLRLGLQLRNCTEVRFASFLSGGFITAILVNRPESKQQKAPLWIALNTKKGQLSTPRGLKKITGLEESHSQIGSANPFLEGHVRNNNVTIILKPYCVTLDRIGCTKFKDCQR